MGGMEGSDGGGSGGKKKAPDNARYLFPDREKKHETIFTNSPLANHYDTNLRV